VKVLFVSSEVAPFARTGGLGEFCGALPFYLAQKGIKVDVVLPLYRCVKEGQYTLEEVIEGLRQALGWRWLNFSVYRTDYKGIKIFFIERDEFFDRSFLYATKKEAYFDNAERFIFFVKAVLCFAEHYTENWDIIHCHDWQTALIPVYLKQEFYPLLKVKTLLTIHNLGYQGVFPSQSFSLTNLPSGLFSLDGLEFFGQLNFLKGGIIFSDFLTTVSPTYAKEIQTPNYGFGLDGLLRTSAHKLKGILNGVDYTVWNPEVDPYIVSKYSTLNLEGKEKCKEDLLRICNLPYSKKPILAMVSRLAKQKGIDLLLEILPRLMQREVYFIILGQGEKHYEDVLKSIALAYPRKMCVKIVFDPILSHKIMAGADMLLMPSRYEPCGLAQLYAMRYGTLPIVHNTGGLADTVIDIKNKNGTGFKFYTYSTEAFWQAIERALSCFEQKQLWQDCMRQAMECNFSWGKTAHEYLSLYQALLS